MNKVKGVTISTGITKFKKDNILKAMVHNHRLEGTKHRNVVNQNKDNWYYDFNDNEIKTVSIIEDKEERKKSRINTRKKMERKYQSHFKKQMELMTKRNKEKGFNPPKERDLNPIAEGVINFGNIYDIKSATNEHRMKMTNQFHNTFTEEEWNDIFYQLKENMEKFCSSTNTELLDFTFHRDEGGLYHIHYLMTNYNNLNGEHLNIRQNKNGIGYRLQDTIIEEMDKYGFERAKGRKNKKTMSKEELIKYRELNQEIKEKQNELDSVNEEIYRSRDEQQNIANQTMKLIEEGNKMLETLSYIVKVMSDLNPNDPYNTQKKLEKVLKSVKYAISKGNLEIARERIIKFEEVIEAYEKRNDTNVLSEEYKRIKGIKNP